LPEAERLKYPHANDHHDDQIQDGLDTSGHRHVSIDKPKDDPGYHQSENNID
jgi:hypothetical protein